MQLPFQPTHVTSHSTSCYWNGKNCLIFRFGLASWESDLTPTDEKANKTAPGIHAHIEAKPVPSSCLAPAPLMEQLCSCIAFHIKNILSNPSSTCLQISFFQLQNCHITDFPWGCVGRTVKRKAKPLNVPFSLKSEGNRKTATTFSLEKTQ